MLPCFRVPSTIQTGMAARDGLFEPREKTKNLASALFRGLRLCNPLKSHKIAKGFFGNPWQKQAEIWKCLEKKLGGGQTRPGDAGPRISAQSRHPSGEGKLLHHIVARGDLVIGRALRLVSGR